MMHPEDNPDATPAELRVALRTLRYTRNAEHMKFQDTIAQALEVRDRSTYSLEGLVERIKKLQVRNYADELIAWCKQTSTTLHVAPNGFVTLTTSTKTRLASTTRNDGDLARAVAEHGKKVLS